jgi:hypothetical protein
VADQYDIRSDLNRRKDSIRGEVLGEGSKAIYKAHQRENYGETEVREKGKEED